MNLDKYKTNTVDNSGWTFDFAFLNKIRDEAENLSGEDITLEEVEAVLMVLSNIDPKMKRVQITPYATATVSEDCSPEVLDTVKKMAELAYENSDKLIKKQTQ